MYLKKNILAAFLMAMLSVSAAGEMVLHENRLGDFPLAQGMRITIPLLRASFPAYGVERKIGQQDGPDYVYFELSESDAARISLETLDEDATRLARVIVDSARVPDQYGLRVGMPYLSIKQARPGLRLTTEHYHTYVTIKGSNIVYEIAGEFDGVDRQHYSERDVRDWRITRIIWVRRAE